MRNLLIPPNPDRCVPFTTIGEGDSSKGSRLGGRAPKGIAPRTIGPKTKYLATFCIGDKPTRELSIFLNFDVAGFVENYGEMLTKTDLVHAIVHSESVRGETNELTSHLSEHPIEYEAESDDWVEGWEGELEPDSESKLGGRPHLQYPLRGLRDEVERLERQGLFQLVQIAFPNTKGGSVSGSWPFGTGWFHLFGKEPFDDDVWHYFWEM
jgi:hypothetical protein